MKENRRRFLAEEKVKILRKHLAEKAPISDVCDEYGMTHVKTSPYYPQREAKLALAMVIQKSPMPKKTSLLKARYSLNRKAKLSSSR